MENDLFLNKTFISNNFLNVTASDAYWLASKQKAILIDVRELSLTFYKQFDVPGLLYIPYSLLNDRLHELSGTQPLIIADSAGILSREAMQLLLDSGFQNVANLAGGLVDWERKGLPITINLKERLSGSCMCQLRTRNNS